MARETLTPERMKPVAEALLFASDEPVPAARLAQLLGKGADAKTVRKLVDELNAEYAGQGRAFEVVEIAGGFQLLTRPEFKDWVAELHRHRRQDKLTPSAVETLAIVAYKQPIQRATVDDIRGVQTGPLLRSLLERGLIKVVGRQNVPGRPILYGTSRIFLQHFGLKSLKDLPRVAELAPP
ncbi:MAG: SMC-Scp complex subunit ScpB [Candidatus Brocadiia bacterium]|jgi:segregation and condensation protein B